MSPAKLAALLKDVFGQNEVCFINDDLPKGQENGSKSGYTVIAAKRTAEQHVALPRTVDDSAFLLTIQKADRQPWRPWTKGSEPAAKRQRTQESSSLIVPSTLGPLYPYPAYTYPRVPAVYPYYFASYQLATAAYLIPPPPPLQPPLPVVHIPLPLSPPPPPGRTRETGSETPSPPIPQSFKRR